jgi:hypothetical protein
LIRRFLPWRPGHLSAAEEVEMDMVNHLPTGAFAVDHSPEPGVLDLFFFGQPVGYDKEMPDLLLIPFFEIEKRRYVLFGDHQNMDGGLGVQIRKGDTAIVFVQNMTRGFVFYNAAKNTFAHDIILLFKKLL